MKMDRRTFLKGLGTGIAGAATGSFLLPGRLDAKGVAANREFMGVLVDTTRCVGCRSCEAACADAHGLPIPDISDTSAFNNRVRQTSERQLSVVNRFKTEKGEVFAKKQCMHCNQPACVSACPVKAMEKRIEGPVTWDTNCIGCRYCMVSCPFDIPRFEHNSAAPRLQKCDLCWDRLKKGEKPACVEACPSETLAFGTRRTLIEEANRRIYQDAGKYVSHIYGEREVGGTGYLYLSAVPFEQIGFRSDLGTTAYPEYTKGFLYSVPAILLLWPAFLSGVSAITKRKDRVSNEGGER